MIRLRDTKIDDPAYYEAVWQSAVDQKQPYDAVRQRALLQHIGIGGQVLELGAGIFGAIQYYLEHVLNDSMPHDFDFYVQDFSPTAAAIVSAKHPEVGWFTKSLDEGIGWRRESRFDSVIAGEVIEHMEAPAALIRECSRVLKPGGWLTVSTVDTYCADARKLHPPVGHYPEHLWGWDDPEDLAALFAGLFSEVIPSRVGNYLFVEARK